MTDRTILFLISFPISNYPHKKVFVHNKVSLTELLLLFPMLCIQVPIIANQMPITFFSLHLHHIKKGLLTIWLAQSENFFVCTAAARELSPTLM